MRGRLEGRGRARVRSRVGKRFWGDRVAACASIWLVLVALAAATADLWVPGTLGAPLVEDTSTIPERMLLSPSAEHPFGTDSLGRDVAARVVYGARTSLLVAAAAVCLMTLIGLTAGGLAALRGRWWDAVLMRTADVFVAFPVTLFSLVFIALVGDGMWSVFLVIALLGWPGLARVFRSSVLAVKDTEYVQAARSLGASRLQIVVRHILPNAIGPVMVYSTMAVGAAILAEAGLSFLGVGLPPDRASWGRMLKEAWELTGTAPWVALFPGIAVTSTVLACMLMGEGLRSALDVKAER